MSETLREPIPRRNFLKLAAGAVAVLGVPTTLAVCARLIDPGIGDGNPPPPPIESGPTGPTSSESPSPEPEFHYAKDPVHPTGEIMTEDGKAPLRTIWYSNEANHISESDVKNYGALEYYIATPVFDSIEIKNRGVYATFQFQAEDKTTHQQRKFTFYMGDENALARIIKVFDNTFSEDSSQPDSIAIYPFPTAKDFSRYLQPGHQYILDLITDFIPPSHPQETEYVRTRWQNLRKSKDLLPNNKIIAEYLEGYTDEEPPENLIGYIHTLELVSGQY